MPFRAIHQRVHERMTTSKVLSGYGNRCAAPAAKRTFRTPAWRALLFAAAIASVPALLIGCELKLAEGGNVQRTVHTPDGRVLAVEDRGDPAGRPVLVHHGSPSSRHSAFYGPYVRDAAERGLRLIGYDRPGFGESSPQPGRTVADCSADVRAICAELGIDRMVTW